MPQAADEVMAQPVSAENWLEDARLRCLRALLKATIVLSVVLAALGFAFGVMFYGAISIAGLLIYSLLFVFLPRWGGGIVASLFTITFNVITLVYLMRGRGIFSVHIVLVPAGMFIGALLVERKYLHVLFGSLVIAVAGIGFWKIVWPGGERVMQPAERPEIAIVALMLVVASILAWIIVEALQEMLVERVRAEETLARHVASLEFHAYHDELTGLPNRASFFRRFDELQATPNARCVVAVLDIHRFRDVVDALGHRLGDDLIRAFAAKLEHIAKGAAQVYRIGAGEFAILLDGPASDEDVLETLRRIVTAMRGAVEVGGIALDVGAYSGFAIVPEDGADAEEVLRRARVALRSAENSVTHVQRYSKRADQNAPERLSLLADLRKALHNDEIVLHFQPIVAMATGEVISFEALVRWQHPAIGLLLPDAFLPLAEEGDMINDLTDLVVARSMAQLHEWLASYERLTMSVNLSARSLLDRNCSQRLLEIIQAAGVAPSQVTFELTETAVMTDRDLARSMLSRITETGARLAIDDFGIGYSSLSYLRHFPVSEIKIDRSFVSDIVAGGQSLAIVRSTIQLAQNLDLMVVAEGIEDQQTATALGEIHCPYAQGYFFARPAPAAEIEHRLADGGSLRVHPASN